jgi:hypothetical protein
MLIKKQGLDFVFLMTTITPPKIYKAGFGYETSFDPIRFKKKLM